MRVIITEDALSMGKAAAALGAEEIKANPSVVLGLPTGSTPLPMYEELARLHKEEGLDFSNVISYNMDEYLGLAPDHDQSYRYFMETNFFSHINIKKENTHVLDGLSKDPAATAAAYEEAIKNAGGLATQFGGIGGNGHLAFNEPGSAFDSLTRVVDLTEETIKDNARFFANEADVPRQALSIGLGTIMAARRVIILANKENKADAVAAAIEGPVTTDCPASVLQNHPNAIFVVEKMAASKLTKEYATA